MNRLDCSALRGKDSHEYGVQGQETEALDVIVRKWPGWDMTQKYHLAFYGLF